MKPRKLNCWEYKECKEESAGVISGKFGICPASLEKSFDGVHDGIKAGRACWLVAGTMCGGRIQGSFKYKFKKCSSCTFYELVKKEEGDKMVPNEILMRRIKDV